MSTLIEEKKKTAANAGEIVEARIVANYGDPGIDEDNHFDILSKYVLVMLESYQRVVTKDKYSNMFALVRRPESLWIEAASTPNGNPTNQRRTDAKGNASIGIAGSFSTNGISRIYPAYTFGEVIRIRRLFPALKPNDSFFYSAFTTWNAGTYSYNSWHTEGSSLPYFQDAVMQGQLRQKTINPITANGHYYNGFLHKAHYEAFYLNLAQGDTSLTNGAISIYNRTWNGNPAVYSAHGGYLFDGQTHVLLNAVTFEDVNVNNKSRVAANECIPLIVTTPNSFPVPSSRSIGTIIYNPTYSPVSLG